MGAVQAGTHCNVPVVSLSDTNATCRTLCVGVCVDINGVMGLMACQRGPGWLEDLDLFLHFLSFTF